jgi:hypothetical protein
VGNGGKGGMERGMRGGGGDGEGAREREGTSEGREDEGQHGFSWKPR